MDGALLAKKQIECKFYGARLAGSARFSLSAIVPEDFIPPPLLAHQAVELQEKSKPPNSNRKRKFSKQVAQPDHCALSKDDPALDDKVPELTLIADGQRMHPSTGGLRLVSDHADTNARDDAGLAITERDESFQSLEDNIYSSRSFWRVVENQKFFVPISESLNAVERFFESADLSVSDAFATEMKRDHTFATSKDNFFSVPVKSEDDGTRSSGHFRESQSFLYQRLVASIVMEEDTKQLPVHSAALTSSHFDTKSSDSELTSFNGCDDDVAACITDTAQARQMQLCGVDTAEQSMGSSPHPAGAPLDATICADSSECTTCEETDTASDGSVSTVMSYLASFLRPFQRPSVTALGTARPPGADASEALQQQVEDEPSEVAETQELLVSASPVTVPGPTDFDFCKATVAALLHAGVLREWDVRNCLSEMALNPHSHSHSHSHLLENPSSSSSLASTSVSTSAMSLVTGSPFLAPLGPEFPNLSDCVNWKNVDEQWANSAEDGEIDILRHSAMVELGDVERSVNLTLMNLHGAMQLYRCVDDEAEWRKKEEKVRIALSRLHKGRRKKAGAGAGVVSALGTHSERGMGGRFKKKA